MSSFPFDFIVSLAPANRIMLTINPMIKLILFIVIGQWVTNINYSLATTQ